MTPCTIIFYGPSGSGKGTQARFLKEYFGARDPERTTLYFEGGALLRRFLEDGSGYTHTHAQELINTGNLLPSFIPVWLFTEFFVKHYSGDEHLILDGLRRLVEAEILDDALAFYQTQNVHVFVITVSEETSRERLKRRGRADDLNEEHVAKRLSWYKEEVIPSIDFFRHKDGYHVHDIDGEQPVERIQEDIIKILTVA